MSAARVQLPLSSNSQAKNIVSGKIQDRVGSLNWPQLTANLHSQGWARTEAILTSQECLELREQYANDALFRSKVIMARHRFGLGEYKYFSYPLPELVAELRESLYLRLSEVANDWAVKLGGKPEYPGAHREFIKRCHAKGQTRPTPLMLRYEGGGYNCLHQDLYGTIYFPLQTVFMLDEPEQDFTGGEFVLVEQRPRAQSAAHVIAPKQGEGVIFTTRWRPVQGTKGHYRINIKHGVSTVTRGTRHTLGIVYHDAE